MIEPSPQRRGTGRPFAFTCMLIVLAALGAFFFVAQRSRQELAVEAARVAPEVPALALVDDLPVTDPAATEEASAPPVLDSYAVTAETEDEKFSPNDPTSSETELPAQPASDEAAVWAPIVETSDPPDQENIEQGVPVVASNSSSSDTEIAATEAAPEQFLTVTEAAPPAEGPVESEQPIAEIAPALSLPTVEEAAPNESLIEPRQIAPQEITRVAREATPPLKEVPMAVALPSPIERSTPHRAHPVASVGHIFFPVWPEKQMDPVAASSPASGARNSPRRQYPVATVGHIFPPSSGNRMEDAAALPFPGSERRAAASELPVLPALPPN